MYYPTQHSVLALFVGISLVCVASAAPVVPVGFAVEKYVDMINPAIIDVDSSGNVYVGNGELGFTPVRIRKIAPDRSVTEIGDPIPDPDGVIVDDSGNVASVGNVIVGANNDFVEVNPTTGQTTTIFTGIPDYNVANMAFDSTGRLFAGHAARYVTVIDGGVLSVFAEFAGAAHAIAIDENDQLFVGVLNSDEIYVIDLTSDTTPRLLADLSLDLFSFEYSSDPGPFSSTLLMTTQFGEIYSVDTSNGNETLLASGFGGELHLAAAPDGSLFVSDYGTHAIYRIYVVPEPTCLGLVLGGVLFHPIRRRKIYSCK